MSLLVHLLQSPRHLIFYICPFDELTRMKDFRAFMTLRKCKTKIEFQMDFSGAAEQRWYEQRQRWLPPHDREKDPFKRNEVGEDKDNRTGSNFPLLLVFWNEQERDRKMFSKICLHPLWWNSSNLIAQQQIEITESFSNFWIESPNQRKKEA